MKQCTIPDCEDKPFVKGLCSKCYYREWNKNNPDKTKAKRRRHYVKHRKELVAKAKEIRDKDPEKHNAMVRRHYHANKEMHSERAAIYYAKNKDKLCKNSKDWWKANRRKKPSPFARWAKENTRENLKIIKSTGLANYRLKKRYGEESKITTEQVWQRVMLFGSKCWVCGFPCDSLDHVKPSGKKGANLPCNIRPCCEICNQKKHAKWPFKRKVKF